MSYFDMSREAALGLREKETVRILSLETSCDETAAAVVENGRKILGNVVFSQIDLHELYGGVVPEIASRAHMEACGRVVGKALEEAGAALGEIDALAVTKGPGLVGALLTGVNYMKGLAFAAGKPLVGVNHIEGHVSANYLSHPELEPPFLCLVVSGGHSHLVEVCGYGEYRLIGRTADDAAGEAFDKVARVLDIPYPGGPLLDKLAEEGDENRYTFPKMHTVNRYDFSFSGLKTAVINQAHSIRQAGGEIVAKDWAASFRKAVVDALLDKTLLAARDTGAKKLALAGGVAANRLLRRETLRRGEQAGLKVYMPPIGLCTDNAVMIGSAAYYRLKKGEISDLDLNAQPSIRLIEE